MTRAPAMIAAGSEGLLPMRLALLLFLSVSAWAQTSQGGRPVWQPEPGSTTLALWPGAAPGISGATAEPEINVAEPAADATRAGSTARAPIPARAPVPARAPIPARAPVKVPPIAGRSVLGLGNVSAPTLTLYQPPGKGAAVGPAVLVFPGGGYRLLAIDLEGTEVCAWLTRVKVACVLVKYRVPDSGPYPKSSAALDDAQRAMGMVRAHAAEWGIDPHRVGVLGFSAGGHLAAALSTHYDARLYPAVDAADALACRPDFAVVIYPGYLADAEHDYVANADIHVTGETPPTFVLQAENDPVHVENAVTYFMQLKVARVPSELHVYAEGGHGYGLRRTPLPVTEWPVLVERWMQTIGVLQKPGPQ